MAKGAGLYWHTHHDILLEWCYDYEERAEYIRAEKPKKEQGTRLRLFQPVKGILPLAVTKAGQAIGRAGQVIIKVWQAYNEAGQAYDDVVLAHKQSIENLHKKECPNCPWNGQTIFSG